MSKIKGINWREDSNAYAVRSTWKGKTFFIGSYTYYKEAVDALDEFKALIENIYRSPYFKRDENGEQTPESINECHKEIEHALETQRDKQRRTRAQQRANRKVGVNTKIAELEQRIKALEKNNG